MPATKTQKKAVKPKASKKTAKKQSPPEYTLKDRSRYVNYLWEELTEEIKGIHYRKKEAYGKKINEVLTFLKEAAYGYELGPNAIAAYDSLLILGVLSATLNKKPYTAADLLKHFRFEMVKASCLKLKQTVESKLKILEDNNREARRLKIPPIYSTNQDLLLTIKAHRDDPDIVQMINDTNRSIPKDAFEAITYFDRRCEGNGTNRLLGQIYQFFAENTHSLTKEKKTKFVENEILDSLIGRKKCEFVDIKHEIKDEINPISLLIANTFRLPSNCFRDNRRRNRNPVAGKFEMRIRLQKIYDRRGKKIKDEEIENCERNLTRLFFKKAHLKIVSLFPPSFLMLFFTFCW